MQALAIQGCSPGCVWFSCSRCRPLDYLIRCPQDRCGALHAIDALTHGWIICVCDLELRLVPARDAQQVAEKDGATVHLALVATFADALLKNDGPIDSVRLTHLAITRGDRHVPQALLVRPGTNVLETLYLCPFCRALHGVGDEQCCAQRQLH